MTAREAQRIVRLAWQTGHDYQPDGLTEAADDVRNAPTLAPPGRPYEQRVADRLDEMAALGAPDPWPGAATRRVRSAATKTGVDTWEFLPDPHGVLVLAEPVPWEGGPDWVPAGLRDTAEKQRQHDAQILREGLAAAPINDWRQIHAAVNPLVWARVWRDLAPGTQQRLPDLAPGRVR